MRVGAHWKYSVYIDHAEPDHGLTGWIRLRLSSGSMPNHGEKNARERAGDADTVHVISRVVMRS